MEWSSKNKTRMRFSFLLYIYKCRRNVFKGVLQGYRMSMFYRKEEVKEKEEQKKRLHYRFFLGKGRAGEEGALSKNLHNGLDRFPSHGSVGRGWWLCGNVCGLTSVL